MRSQTEPALRAHALSSPFDTSKSFFSKSVSVSLNKSNSRGAVESLFEESFPYPMRKNTLVMYIKVAGNMLRWTVAYHKGQYISDFKIDLVLGMCCSQTIESSESNACLNSSSICWFKIKVLSVTINYTRTHICFTTLV
jgi:hypothetical protein